MDNLENKQNNNLESVKIYLERTGRKKVTKGSGSKVLFNKPKKKDMNELINKINNSRADNMNEDEINVLRAKKNQINDDIDEEAKDEDLEENNRVRKNKLIIKKVKISENEKKSKFKMQKINHFRAYVYAVIAERKFRMSKKQDYVNSIRQFVNKYEIFDDKINNWVNNSTNVAYLSVVNFEDLKLDISESGLFFKNSESDLKDKFIKLEVK